MSARLRKWLILSLLAAGSVRAELASVDSFAKLPVLDNGRVMPMDSFARQNLLRISGKSTFNRKPAILWLARVFFEPESTRRDAIFLVNNPEVVQALGLTAEGRGRYSYEQLQPMLPELTRLARAAFHVEDKDRSPVETEIIQLYSSMNTYVELLQAFDFAVPRPEFDLPDQDLRKALELPDAPGISPYELRARRERMREVARQSAEKADAMEQLARMSAMWAQHRHDVPPALIPVAGETQVDWIGAWDAYAGLDEDRALMPMLDGLQAMIRSFQSGDQAGFDRAAGDFMGAVRAQPQVAKSLKKLDFEAQYNRADAFYRSEMLYGFAFLLALLSVAFRPRWIYWLSGCLVALALAPHTYGIVARMIIMGRPPVTNLYSTFVFVGWTCALIGLVVEYFQRNRLGLITASSMGLALLLTSGRFGNDNDTMGVMVAVLDSNFWLATHVVCISIGYAGCVASGLLAHIYLLQALRKTADDPVLRETERAVYGAQAFGLIFSFLGTMLGGIWADQSWGRFWGWDPKENGALVIVLWSAILFHARLGRMIGPRGFAAGSVLGVIAVLCAWIGVNLLGVGLHSYGFTSGLARGLAISAAVEILFVLVTVPLARKGGTLRPPAPDSPSPQS